jgi:hypothetical protein
VPPSTPIAQPDSTTAAADGCLAFTCVHDCTGICGWNRALAQCVAGATSTNAEKLDNLGDCPDPTTAPQDPCAAIQCVLNCGDESSPTCGWAKNRNLCVSGATTTSAEIAMRLGNGAGCPAAQPETTTAAATSTAALTATATNTATNTATATTTTATSTTTLSQPETTDAVVSTIDTTPTTSLTPNIFFGSTSGPLTGGGGGGDHADCRVNFHQVDDLVTVGGSATGVCPTAAHLDHAILNSSVGFTSQICVDHDTDVGGLLTSLHMTIQPICKVNDNDAQKWLVCSWLRDPDSPLCQARPDVECCAYVNSFISPPKPMSSTLSCQEYYEGDCNKFYGYQVPANSEKGISSLIQEYALELVGCDGVVPPNPTCQRGRLQAGSPVVEEAVAGGLGLIGGGMLVLAAAMFLRRGRLGGSERTEYEVDAPDETSPLVHF